MVPKRKVRLILVLTVFIFNIFTICSFSEVNGMRVTYAVDSSQINGYNTSDITNSESILPLAEGRSEFLKYGKPMLMFVRPWSDKNSDNRKLKLIYSIVNGPYYFLDFNAINAKTGKPVNSLGEEINLYNEKIGETGQEYVNKEIEDLAKPLNEEEAKQIAVNEAAKYNIMISSSEKYQVQYNANWYGLNQSVYTFTWGYDQDNSTDRLKITVNMKNGAVLEFYHNIKNDDNKLSSSLTWSEGKDKAIEFVKDKFPQFLGNIVFIKNEPSLSAKSSNDGYYYSFWRVINGAVYPENNISVMIDNKSGEIKAYGYRWEYIDFPEISSVVISQEEAANIFMDNIGLQLNTRGALKDQNSTQEDKNSKDVIVYEVKPGNAAYIDAYNGKLKDSKGNDIIFNSDKEDY